MRITAPAPEYDVVIAGGGMVGASFACALSQACAGTHLSILVVEAIPQVQEKAQEKEKEKEKESATATQPSFDSRSTALSSGSSQIFARMGLWPKLQDVVTPIQEIRISDRGHFGSACITAAEQQVEALGYVVENRDLGNCLNEALASSAILQWLCPALISNAKPVANGMALQIEVAGQTHDVTAGLLVLADGGKSSVCEQLGIGHHAEPYKQQALIANIAFELPHKNIAFERFTDTGPLAILPLADIDGQQRGSLVWTLRDEQVTEYLALSEAELMARLQERFGNRLGRIRHIGKRYCYPLSLSIATEQVRPGLVLLGNVAHTLHPVAGQGLNLALRDAETLALVLAKAWAAERGAAEKPGSMTVLQRYLQAQQQDQNLAINFTDFATRLFSSNNTAKVLTRKFGLLAIDLVPALRHEFAKQAMGLAVTR